MIMVMLPLGLRFPIWKVGTIEVSDILRNKGVTLKRWEVLRPNLS